MVVKLPKHNNILFDTEFSLPKIASFLFTLDCIADLFDKYFPEKVTHPLMVSFSDNADSPICYRKLQRIFLNTNPFLWSQAAYQFSHELCHYMIPDEVCSNLRWFEETICEIASNFFLTELANYWKHLGVTLRTNTGELYFTCFVTYVKKNLKESMPFDIYSNAEIQFLESNCYERDKNKYVASLLLPIFQNHPLIWHAVPQLCGVTPNQSFVDSLLEWKQLSPPCSHEGIDAILQIFHQ